jgi:hypothetical protein
MTGPEALAMGSKEFCARLSKLTGDTKSQAPPPTFRKGMQIEMCWSDEKQGPDIDSFRKFTPATESATVVSIENSNFTCDRLLPLCKGDSVKFVGAPEFLKNDTSYIIEEALGTEFSLSNMSNTKESSHHEQFQVQWHKCLRGVSVKSNYVFHCATHHHLEPNFPIRFASNVGDKIVKNGRVYVKRIVDAFSFTVSLSLTNRDKADVELQSQVAKNPKPKTLPRNLSPTGLLLAYYYDCCAAYMRANMPSIIQFGHPQNKTPVHFLLPSSLHLPSRNESTRRLSSSMHTSQSSSTPCAPVQAACVRAKR